MYPLELPGTVDILKSHHAAVIQASDEEKDTSPKAVKDLQIIAGTDVDANTKINVL
jgi:hypothetical protein